MVDLDADEDQPGCDGGDACRVRVVDVMVMFAPVGLVRGGRRGDACNLGSDGVTSRHQMM
jgi:hypothetical protein